ncbi:MAG: EamA family transporter [Clostridia bacterium]|nr:EamA family transporter [Clostridia bacterium]
MNHIQKIKGYTSILLSAAIYGFMPLVAKFLYAEGVNPLSLIFLRNALALPVLAILALATDRTLKVSPKALPSISGIALVGYCLTPLLLFPSYQYIDSGTATVFHFIYPSVVLVAAFIKNRRIDRQSLLCVLLCALGVGLFYTPGKPLDWRGAALALLSGVAYAVYILLLSAFKHKVPAFTLSFYISLVCSVVMLIVCLATGQLALPTSLGGWLLALLFALMLNVGAAVLFQQGTLIIGGQLASILSTAEPIVSMIVGVLAFREALTAQTAIGAVLVVAASILIVALDIRKADKQTASDPS